MARLGIEALETLDRECQQLEALVDVTEVLGLICDENLTITRASRALCRTLGLRLPQGGLALEEVASRLQEGGELMELVVETQRERRPRERKLRLGPPHGRAFIVRTHPTPAQPGREAAAAGVIVVFSVAGEETKEALREVDRRKDEFLAMLGHELRNPLAAIRNATELIGMIEAGDGALERVQGVLARQVDQMAKLIDDLLDVSRIIRGKLGLERSVLDLGDLLRNLVEDRGSWLEQLELTLNVNLPEAPIWVDGDRVRLVEIFDNVLSNAAKFTPGGGHIHITVLTDDQQVSVRVEDDGIGIVPESLPHVCEPFQQTREARERSSGGLGLGLALVRGLTELHGGTVAVESDGADRGTAVTLTFELAEGPGVPESIPPSRLSPLSVLLVEDDEDMAQTLAELLARRGHQVAVAHTAKEGIDRAHNLRPDVVLSDIGLGGGLDGLDVAQAIRADQSLEGISLIAVTGHAGHQHQQQVNEAGFDACLIKPVALETLERQLCRSRRRHRRL